MQVIEVKPLDTSSAEIALKDSELILSNRKNYPSKD
jgi:hypothetical protein